MALAVEVDSAFRRLNLGEAVALMTMFTQVGASLGLKCHADVTRDTPRHNVDVAGWLMPLEARADTVGRARAFADLVLGVANVALKAVGARRCPDGWGEIGTNLARLA